VVLVPSAHCSVHAARGQSEQPGKIAVLYTLPMLVMSQRTNNRIQVYLMLDLSGDMTVRLLQKLGRDFSMKIPNKIGLNSKTDLDHNKKSIRLGNV
jgi:hypothetical protein